MTIFDDGDGDSGGGRESNGDDGSESGDTDVMWIMECTMRYRAAAMESRELQASPSFSGTCVTSPVVVV
jgi:hypothetical protein